MRASAGSLTGEEGVRSTGSPICRSGRTDMLIILSRSLRVLALDVVSGGLQPMVPSTQDLEVIRAGATLRPGNDVVDIAAFGGRSAPVGDADAVAELQRGAQSWRWIAAH